MIGGSVNLASPLTVEVTRVGPETVLAGIVRLMDRAQAGRPRIAQVADRVAQWFVAALIAVALATAAAWYWIDPQRALWVDGRGAGGELPVRAVAGDAGGARRRDRTPSTGWVSWSRAAMRWRRWPGPRTSCSTRPAR